MLWVCAGLAKAAPLVHITAVDAVAYETGINTATVRVSRDGATTGALVVNYAYTPNDADTLKRFAALSGSVTLPDGASSADITVTPVDNAVKDGSVTLTFTLVPDANYDLPSTPEQATVTLFDDETTPLLIATSSLNVLRENGQDQSNITFQRLGGDQTRDLTVNVQISGTASSSDYVFSMQPRIPANQNAAFGAISPVNNAVSDGDRVLTITLTAPQNPSDYLVGSPGAFTIVILDDDSNAPPANFSLDQMVEKGETANIEVTLLSAPSHPVRIPYTLQGSATRDQDFVMPSGELLINQGSTAGQIQLQTIATTPAVSVDQVVELDMGQLINARAGQFTSHFVILTQRNVAPMVTITAQQAGRQTRLVTPTGGLVTLTATAVDVNKADTFTFDWKGSNPALVQTAATLGQSFVFDPSRIAPGLYKARVTATDGQETPQPNSAELQLQVLSAPHELSGNDIDGDGIIDAQEGFGDFDNDGIPDYLDHSTLPPHMLQQQRLRTDRFVIQTRPGLRLGLGDTAQATELAAALVSTPDLARLGGGEGQPTRNTSDTFVATGGYYDFIVSGPIVATNAQLPLPLVLSVPVVVPQPTPIPSNAVYRQYTSASGWRNFVINDKNQVYSAPDSNGVCPLPGDAIYVVGLTEGHTCVQLRIQDGGPNDADSVVNYVIKSLGGVAAPPNSITNPAPRNPCGGLFCSSGGSNGGGSLAWLMLIVLIAYAYLSRARRRGWQ